MQVFKFWSVIIDKLHPHDGKNSLPFKRGVAVVGLAALGLATVVVIGSNKLNQHYQPSDDSVAIFPGDLLTGQDWSHFAGATQDESGVHVAPLDRKIVGLNNSSSEKNPPINLLGPHLEINGDFEVIADMKQMSASAASFQLYAEVPTVYDEWRHEGPSVQVNVTDKEVSVKEWDGSGKTPVEDRKITGDFGTETILTVRHKGNNIEILEANNQLALLPDHSIFDSRKVWFGASTAPNGSDWTLARLEAGPINKGRLTAWSRPTFKVKTDNSNSLRGLSSVNTRNLSIGAAVALEPLMTNSAYRQLVGSQFSMLTPENAMKAQFIHPQPNKFSFEEADALVAFAEANDMKVHGHALVFGEANPAWMQELPVAERQQAMINHVNKVVGHYKGQVSEWDVVNEPLADSDNQGTLLRNSIWNQAMGELFIDEAFKAARATDPDAKLYMNEYGLEANGDRWDRFIALVGRLQSRGVPIDGIGFQSHVYEGADHVDPMILKAHIEQLAKMGLVSRISEIDVHGENQRTQATEYAGVLGACLAKPTCTAFSTWGVTDLYGSTTDIDSYPPDYGDDLIWDQDLRPKPIFRALKTVLSAR